MRRTTWWRVVQGWYWLALGAWFGALVMLAIAAAAVFGTLRYFPTPLGPMPAEMASRVFNPTEVAGLIVGQAIDWLRVMQWICASIAIVCVVLQYVVLSSWLPKGGFAQWMNTLRITLLMAVVLILAGDSFYVGPRIRHWRAAMHAPSENSVGDVQAAREAFDHYHDLSVRLVKMKLLMLGVAVLSSAFALQGEPGAVARNSS